MRYATIVKLQSLKRPYLSQTELRFVLGGTEDSQVAKVKRAMANGVLSRVRRGLYCFCDPFSREKAHPFALAERIYAPSFISLESALSHHGLIPEGLKIVTSVTVRRRNYFKTPLGDYSYMTVPKKNFLQSVERVVDGDAVYFMATPWRAIADFVYCYKKNWNTTLPLVESLRMEAEEIPILTPEEADELIQYYHHSRITQFLLNALRRQ